MSEKVSIAQLENAVEVDAWVVVEQVYDYNDEYYYFSESEGVAPHAVYFDKARAIAEAERLSKEWAEDEDEEQWEDGIPQDLFQVRVVKVRPGS